MYRETVSQELSRSNKWLLALLGCMISAATIMLSSVFILRLMEASRNNLWA